jgi:hypothetical protein
MDQLYEQLFHREALYLAFIVVIGTFFARRIIETAIPSCKDKGAGLASEYKTKFGLWWNSVILYAIPVVFGGGIAAAAFGSYTPNNITSRGAAVLWGAVIGWCSSFIYKVARKFLKKKTGVDLTPGPSDPTESEKPPAKDDEAEGDKPEKKDEDKKE